MPAEFKETGANTLRRLVRWLDNTNETALDGYTPEELVQLLRMYDASGWDFTLDQWTPEQRADALKGFVPEWDDEERPKPRGKIVLPKVEGRIQNLEED